MRRIFLWSLSAVCLLTGIALSAPSTISYQGRLTTSTGTPVPDGSYSVSFSLWTDSVGGSMIWSESQNVQASGGGLFTTQLGNIQPLGGGLVIHGDNDLYLQLNVSGQDLSPRMVIGTVPRAFSASSLVTTTPNVGSLHASVGSDTTKFTASHESAMGVIDSYIHLVDDRALLGLKAYDPAQSQSSTSGSEVTGGVARNYLDHDDDGDAIPDIVEDFSAGDGSAKIGVKASKRQFTLMDAFPQSFRVVAHDSDTASSVTTALESDLNIDGAPESSISQSTDSSGASQRVEKKGINAINVKLAVTSSVEGDEAKIKVYDDKDDDGIEDQEITSSITPTRAQHAVNTKGTGAQAGRSALVQTTTDPDSAFQILAFTEDGSTGTSVQISAKKGKRSEAELNLNAINKAADAEFFVDTSRSGLDVNFDSDNDGTTDHSATLSVTPTSAKHAINTKGTGAQAGLVLSSRALTDIDSAVTEVSGENGTLSGHARLTAQPSGPTTVTVSSSDASSGTPIVRGMAIMQSSGSLVRSAIELDSDLDGVTDRRITEDCDDEDADITIQAGVAIPKFINLTVQAQSSAQAADVGMLMVSGSDTAIHVGFDDTSSRISVVPPTAGTYVFDLVVTDASGLMSMTGSSGTISIQMDGDGRLGVGGAAHASNPIHHQPSGAHLTSGGVWTNASDENLKENFQSVDGAELLDKIEQLPISEWNYKSESDDVKHIGPTAQDFLKIFGVGENDKTISTIDPSGIALAAIKELNKQNQLLQEQGKDLREQNEQLRKELKDLKAMIDRLASGK